MELFAKIFVERRYGNCSCSVVVATLHGMDEILLTDEKAQTILNDLAQDAKKKCPGGIRVLSAEYISQKEAMEIIRHQTGYPHSRE